MAVSAAVVIGTAYSIYASEEARQEQKEAQKVQKKITDTKTQRQRIQQLREAQMARAQVAVAAEAGGTAESSTAAGQQAGIQSQAGSNIQFINTIENLRQQMQQRLENAASYANRADVASGLTSLAGSSAGQSFVKGVAPKAGHGAPSTSSNISGNATGGG